MKKFLASIETQIVNSFLEPVADLHPTWSSTQVEAEARRLTDSLSEDDAAAIYADLLRG